VVTSACARLTLGSLAGRVFPPSCGAEVTFHRLAVGVVGGTRVLNVRPVEGRGQAYSLGGVRPAAWLSAGGPLWSPGRSRLVLAGGVAACRPSSCSLAPLWGASAQRHKPGWRRMPWAAPVMSTWPTRPGRRGTRRWGGWGRDAGWRYARRGGRRNKWRRIGRGRKSRWRSQHGRGRRRQGRHRRRRGGQRQRCQRLQRLRVRPGRKRGRLDRRPGSLG